MPASRFETGYGARHVKSACYQNPSVTLLRLHQSMAQTSILSGVPRLVLKKNALLRNSMCPEYLCCDVRFRNIVIDHVSQPTTPTCKKQARFRVAFCERYGSNIAISALPELRLPRSPTGRYVLSSAEYYDPIHPAQVLSDGKSCLERM